MLTLTQPDTSTDIHRAGTLIGHVVCLNINPPHQPPAIRWHGKQPGDGASGQARLTQAEAAQDVADWADGKEVAYEQHAVVPLAQADMVRVRTFVFKYSVVHFEREGIEDQPDEEVAERWSMLGPLEDAWDDELSAEEFAGLTHTLDL